MSKENPFSWLSGEVRSDEPRVFKRKDNTLASLIKDLTKIQAKFPETENFTIELNDQSFWSITVDAENKKIIVS